MFDADDGLKFAGPQVSLFEGLPKKKKEEEERDEVVGCGGYFGDGD